VLSGKVTNINFIVFGLTRLGLETTIYGTRDERANHYATDAISHKSEKDRQYNCPNKKGQKDKQ
jgi:hypothetical protein